MKIYCGKKSVSLTRNGNKNQINITPKNIRMIDLINNLKA